MSSMEQLEEQKQRLEAYLAADPANLQLSNQLIDLYIQLGEHKDGLKLIESVEEAFGINPALSFKKSNLLLANAEPQEALATLETIPGSAESKEPILINMAHAHFQLRDFEKVTELLALLEGRPQPSVYILQARTYHHMEKIEKAIELLKEADKYYPNDSDIKGLLSLLLLDHGEFTQDTLNYAETALQSKPYQMESLLTAGMLQQHYHKDLVKAEHYFDQSINTHPHVGRGWLYKGLAVMMRKKLKEAQLYLHKACELMPEHIGTWHSLGWSHILLNEISNAEECFMTSLELDRNFAETHGGISVVQAMQGNSKQAEKSAKIALRLDPQCFSAQYTFMLLEQADNNPEKAQEALQKVFATEQGLEAQEFIKVLQGTSNVKNDNKVQ